jgi:hypothetical protein
VTREEREQIIERLQVENAASLEEIARREERAAAGLDAPDWQAPQRERHRQFVGGDNVTSSSDDRSSGCGRAAGVTAPDDLVFKDFISSERQHVSRPELQDVFHPLQLAVLRKAFKIERQGVRMRQSEALATLRERFDQIEALLAALDARLSELESADGNEGSGYAG